MRKQCVPGIFSLPTHESMETSEASQGLVCQKILGNYLNKSLTTPTWYIQYVNDKLLHLLTHQSL